jgi:cyclase
VLAHRIIPVILYRGHQVVKGKQFDSWRSIGHVETAFQIHWKREVDEILMLDIGATPDGRDPDFDLMRRLNDKPFLPPMTVGGGIRTVEHIRLALANGADKVSINTMALKRPALIGEAAEKFGRQAVSVSIDVRDGRVCGSCGHDQTEFDPVTWAMTVETLGAGEIILNVIERDGMMEGYDLDLIARVSEAVSIPVVACGGAGTYEDFARAIDHGAHAVAAGAMFAFSDATPAGAAEYLASRGYPVRRKMAA